MKWFVTLPLVLASVVLGAQAPPVTVYVTSAGAQQGMTDPSKDNRDTVKDLKESLADYKELALVETPEAAQIILTVQGRQMLDIPSNSVFGGSSASQRRIIRVGFRAGQQETVLEASAIATVGGGFSKAASHIAKQVREWIRANGAQLSAAK